MLQPPCPSNSPQSIRRDFYETLFALVHRRVSELLGLTVRSFKRVGWQAFSLNKVEMSPLGPCLEAVADLIAFGRLRRLTKWLKKTRAAHCAWADNPHFAS